MEMLMGDCNATLTTCTVTADVVAMEGPACPSQIGGNRCLRYPGHEGKCHYGTVDHRWWRTVIPDGVAVVRDGDRLLRLDVTTLTCSTDHDGDVHGWETSTSWVTWTDSTQGATPHTPAVVDRSGGAVGDRSGGCDHCHGDGCMSPTHRGASNACCVCGDWLPDAPAVTDQRSGDTT